MDGFKYEYNIEMEEFPLKNFKFSIAQYNNKINLNNFKKDEGFCGNGDKVFDKELCDYDQKKNIKNISSDSIIANNNLNKTYDSNEMNTLNYAEAYNEENKSSEVLGTYNLVESYYTPKFIENKASSFSLYFPSIQSSVQPKPKILQDDPTFNIDERSENSKELDKVYNSPNNITESKDTKIKNLTPKNSNPLNISGSKTEESNSSSKSEEGFNKLDPTKLKKSDNTLISYNNSSKTLKAFPKSNFFNFKETIEDNISYICKQL